MLLTDIWEMLEYTNEEPPTHLLLRPVASFFGYKFAEPKTRNGKKKKRKASDSEVASVMSTFGRPKPGMQLPKHIRDSPTLRKMFEDMKD